MLALAVPIFTMQVYDRVVYHHGIGTLAGLIIGMLLVILFDFILRQTRAKIMQTVALRVDVMVGKRLFDKLMALPLQVLESRPGSYWNALFRDVDTVRNTLSGATAILLVDLPFVFLFAGVIMVIALPIFWVLMFIIPIFVAVAWRSAAQTSAANAKERQTSQSRDALIAEVVDGRTTIKALALDRSMRPMWEERHAANIENSLVRGSTTDMFSNLGQTLAMLTPVLLTCVGAVAIIGQSLTMGGLTATNMLSGRILGPLNQLVGQWRSYSSFRQAVERLGMVFEAEGERLESEIKLDRPKGNLTIENVNFGYVAEGRPVIDHVSLNIPAGGVVSIVGRNGSGKTTLLKIMLGLYKPSEGRVLLDGADMSQFTRSELADWIGYVPQDCVLFEGSVKSNICQRHAEATDEQVIAAATAAGVHHFIIDLPDGYASSVGEAGRRLSGGQRQRIAIARALLGDPPVLLFDEPSSSLDRQAEQELRNTIVELGKTRTVILVTHSPILLAASDTLIALDRGKVALNGPARDILPKLFGGRRPPMAGEKSDSDGGAASLETEAPATANGAPKVVLRPVPLSFGTNPTPAPTQGSSMPAPAVDPKAGPSIADREETTRPKLLLQPQPALQLQPQPPLALEPRNPRSSDNGHESEPAPRPVQLKPPAPRPAVSPPVPLSLRPVATPTPVPPIPLRPITTPKPMPRPAAAPATSAKPVPRPVPVLMPDAAPAQTTSSRPRPRPVPVVAPVTTSASPSPRPKPAMVGPKIKTRVTTAMPLSGGGGAIPLAMDGEKQRRNAKNDQQA